MRVEGAASHTLVSDYADTDLEEGFAEAFAFYIQRPDTLKARAAASSGFLRDWETRHAH